MSAAIAHWKAKGLDYSRLLHKPATVENDTLYCSETQDHGLETALDKQLITEAEPALIRGEPVEIQVELQNNNRTVGTMLSGRVAERYGHAGLPEDSIQINATGIAGQSFGAWLAQGVSINLTGEANDYVGKGLSGGKLIIAAPQHSGIGQQTDENVIIGNTALFGAISGTAYIQGVAGERFAVRNSGAQAVVEGVGDHGCEYMTGGVIVVLGETGRNFAAGMSGGIAYVLDPAHNFEQRCNLEQVALEPVEPNDTGTEEQIANNPLKHDASRLQQLVKNHAKHTGSTVAQALLNNWTESLPKFRKVMPIEYRRALMEH
jgi:glutamate synthase (NADPH/NADH) large chain